MRVEDKEAGWKSSVAAIEFVNQIFRPATVGVGRQLPNGATSLGEASLQAAIASRPIKIALTVKYHPTFREVSVTIVGIELVQYLIGLRQGSGRA